MPWKCAEMYCIECGKYLGEVCGHIDEKALINGNKYEMCPLGGKCLHKLELCDEDEDNNIGVWHA